MSIQISDDLIRSSGLNEHDLKIESAITLFQNDKLTLAQASRMAEMPQLFFQRELAKRKISLHYSLEDLQIDLKNIGIERRRDCCK
ncbi:MAG: UPF0175 family protein [Ignavibacteriae bacterium]|nr:UPF0175 family protein [Ignavibacteriota bacterium]